MHNQAIIKALKNVAEDFETPKATALDAVRVIKDQEAQIQTLEASIADAKRQIEALRAAAGMNTWPVDEQTSISLVNAINNKHMVSDHFTLTPQDVANIINHVRLVVKSA